MFLRKKIIDLRRIDRCEALPLQVPPDILDLLQQRAFLFEAAPTPSVRGTPAGYKLKDGYSTKIAFASNLTVEFWEKTVQPTGMDGLEKIDQTTMHNNQWRTFRPRALVTQTDSTLKVAYNPLVNTSILSLVNKEDTITEIFPDGSTKAYYGFLKSFIPDAHEEGKQPEATIVICATNFDKTNNVEAGPAYSDVAGT